MCGIFVGIPDDTAGWLFYVPTAKRMYISMDAAFDEAFSSPLVLPDLPYQGAIRLRQISTQNLNQDSIIEYTDAPSGQSETFSEDLGLPNPTRKHTTADISDTLNI